MYNLRYHVASLVAVFLALTVGLLLGTVVAERGVLDRQREALVAGLQKDFAALSEANSRLSQDNDAHAEFIDSALPTLVGGRLDGATVAILIAEGQNEDAYSATVDAVLEAGGQPLRVAISEPGFSLDETQTLEAVATLFPPTTTDLRASVITSLAAELSTTGPRPVSDALRELGVLGGEVLPDDVGVRGLAVMASWEDGPDALAVELGVQLAARGVAVLGVEGTTARAGLVLAAVEGGLSAVDHVDTPQGAYSVVMVLAQQAQGHFGLLDEADGRFPIVATQ
ncbi:MAG: copper transporter [Actinobacteria bacterium]|nr:copper transporter [Actinomycetota bacterium]MCL5887317.1 copper transporter [Actinomycetota bacterium]